MSRKIFLSILFLLFLLSWLAPATAGFLPPLDRRWRTFSTEHFHFYFHPETEELARRLAPIAEAVHERLTRELGMSPREPTHVLIYDDVDQYNGMAGVFPRNTIHLFATGQYVGDQGKIGDSPVEIFVHEYTHILQLGYVSNLPEAINRLVRNLLFPNALLPAWCAEGLAVAMESEFSPSGRLHASTWRMYLRADFLAGRTLTWPQVTNGVYRWPYENAWYLYGSFFTQYLIERFGREKVAEFYRATGGDLPYLTFAACFRTVFGADLDSLVADWYHKMAAEFAAEAARISAEGICEGRPVGAYGGFSGKGCFAPGGRLYFLRRTLDAPGALMASDPPYETAKTFTRFAGTNPAVSPDGRFLLYGLATPQGENLFYDLYLLDLKTRRGQRLTQGLRANDPAWSPTGEEIVFVKNEPPHYALYLMRADGSEIRPLWRPEGLEQAFTPAWSPKGDRIVFARYRPEEGVRLWTIRPDGTGLAPLHEGAPLGEEIQPAWSPDGRYVFFAADPTGVFNIYAYDTVASCLYRVTNVLTGAYEPTVSPDGKTLAYTGYSTYGYDQYVMTLEPLAWKIYTASAGPRVVPAMPPPAEGYFRPETPPEEKPAKPYSPWPTLAPSLGYVLISANTKGDYGLSLALFGSDVLETISYGLTLTGGPSGPEYDAGVDFRLPKGFTLSWRSSLVYSEETPTPSFSLRTQFLALSRTRYGLLVPDDGFAWQIVAYEQAKRPLLEGEEPETYRGGGVAFVYDRSAFYRGPVDLAYGYRVGGEWGKETYLEQNETNVWAIGWGSLYLPLGRSRLELGGAVGRDSLGKLRSMLGKGFVRGPEGSLVWEAEAFLEFPLAWPESGGTTTPDYLHAVNGLCSLSLGQSLAPTVESAWAFGLGINFRLQVGFHFPLDVAAMWIRRFDEPAWYFAIWSQTYSW
ncbi:MAG: TolB family protein [Bacillota bacterium]